MGTEVLVISGPTLSGKSWLIRHLSQLPELREAPIVRMDDIGHRYWSGRLLTTTEKLFRNELTRMEVKRLLIIERPRHLLLEIPLLTRARHQRPFVDMIFDARRQIREIDAERHGNTAHDAPSITMRAVLLYTSHSVSMSRLAHRRDGAIGETSDVLDAAAYVRAVGEYEIPDASDYLPLAIDTSDAAGDQSANIVSEAARFLLGAQFEHSMVQSRLLAARTFFESIAATPITQPEVS